MLFLYSSCEEDYIIDSGNFQSKLVLNSLFTHDQQWSVEVSHTKYFLDDSEFKNVDDAIVEIYSKSGNFLYNLIQDENGIYTNETEKPEYGKCYSIKVKADGYNTILAQDAIPEIGEIKVKKQEFTDIDGNKDTRVSFSLGKADEDTYVVWEIYTEEESLNLPKNNIRLDWLNQLSKNPKNVVFGGKFNVGQTSSGNITTTLGDINGGKPLGPINDQLAGSIFDVTPTTKDDLTSNVLLGDGEDDDDTEEGTGGSGDSEPTEEVYELRVMTISKELHDYYKSVEDYLRFNPNSTDIQPSRVKTNVNNGFGIFAAYSEKVVKF